MNVKPTSFARYDVRVSGPFTASKSNGLQGKILPNYKVQMSTARGNPSYWVDAVWASEVRLLFCHLIMHSQ